MIKLTRINQVEQFWLNEDKIEYMEENHDTVLSLEGGKKLSVAESAEEVVNRIIEHKRRIFVQYLPR